MSTLIEIIKNSKFWDSQYQNFNATIEGSREFLNNLNLTTNKNIGISTGIKALVGFEKDFSQYESLKKQRKVDIYELKESSYGRWVPEFSEIYIIDENKKAEIEKAKAEAQRVVEAKNAEIEKAKAERLAKQENDKAKKRQELRDKVLPLIENKTFGDLLKDCQNSISIFKYRLENEILPAILNEDITIINKYGDKKTNPKIVVRGSKSTGYHFGETQYDKNLEIVKRNNIDFNKKITDFLTK